MSAEAVLDDAFTILLDKARARAADQQVAANRPATINVEFSGGGSALTVGLPSLYRIPFPCVIQSVEMYAGNEAGSPVLVTASVDLWLTSILSFSSGGTTVLHGGTKPALTAQSSTTIDISGWLLNLIPTDRLVGRIATWSGTATWLALVMQILPTEVPLSSATVVDETGLTVVDDTGATVVYRR